MSPRRPLTGVAVLFFVNGAAFGSWLPRLPELRDHLDLTLTQVGVILAMMGLGGLVGSAASGWLVGRLGAKRVAVGPAFVLMALLPGVGLAPGALLLAGVVLLAAIVDSFADVGMNALAVRAQESRVRSIFTRLHALWSIGSLGGAALSTGAAALQIPLAVQLTAVALTGAVSVAWAGGGIPATEPRARMRSRPTLTMGILAVGASVALVEGIPHDWSAILLADVLAAPPAVAAFGFIALSAGMVVGRLAGDRVVDRVGANRSILAGLGVVALATVATVAAPSVWIALVGFTGWGLGVSVVLPLLYRLAGSHRGLGEGTGLAALTVGSRLGFMAGPTTVGAAAGVVSLPVALGIVVAVALAASAATIFAGLSR